jgi:hypothetical protein
VQEIAIFRAKEWIAFADAHCSLTNLHNKRVDGIKKKKKKFKCIIGAKGPLRVRILHSYSFSSSFFFSFPTGLSMKK